MLKYTHNQRERAEQTGSMSPSQYSDEVYSEAYRRKSKDSARYGERYKERYSMDSYRSESPGSDHVSGYQEDTRYPVKDKYYSHEQYMHARDSDHSPSGEVGRTFSPDGHSWSRSPSRNRQSKDQRDTPPTPTGEDMHNLSRDHSPMDMDQLKNDDFNITAADIEELQSSHSSRKGSKHMKKRQYEDSFGREHSNLYEESLRKRNSGRTRESRKDLVQKMQQIESEINDKSAKLANRSHDSSSSSGCIDSENEQAEAELSKLQHEKLALLDRLKCMDSSSSENEASEMDSSDKRKVIKRTRVDSWHKQSSASQRLGSVVTTTKKSSHGDPYDPTQSYRKQMEAFRRIEEQGKDDQGRSSKDKKSGYISDNEDHHVLASPNEIPSSFVKRSKKYKAIDESGLKRSYRSKKGEEGNLSSDNEDFKAVNRTDSIVSLRRLSSGHSSPRTPVFSQPMEHHRHSESELSASEGHVPTTPRKKEAKEGKHRSHSLKEEMTLIPLGDDNVPNVDVKDPRHGPLHEDEHISLPLPKFASYTPPLFPAQPLYSGDHSDNTKSDSPCFSPPSSGSKQSPDLSPNDSSGPSDSASGEILGQKVGPNAYYPEDEGNQVPSDGNAETTDSEKRREGEEGDLSNSEHSDMELNEGTEPMDTLDIEERIRRLDEKLSQSSKIPPAKTCAEQLSPISIPSVTTANQTNCTPIDVYSKYKIRKKVESVTVNSATTTTCNNTTNNSTTESKNGEPSEIVRTVLSRSSIFDQDTERLKQINDKYTGSTNSANVEEPPKVTTGLIRTKAAAKEMPSDVPLSTLPGSLADRLGNGGSAFPTLSVNTTIANETCQQHYISDSTSTAISSLPPASVYSNQDTLQPLTSRQSPHDETRELTGDNVKSWQNYSSPNTNSRSPVIENNDTCDHNVSDLPQKYSPKSHPAASLGESADIDSDDELDLTDRTVKNTDIDSSLDKPTDVDSNIVKQTDVDVMDTQSGVDIHKNETSNVDTLLDKPSELDLRVDNESPKGDSLHEQPSDSDNLLQKTSIVDSIAIQQDGDSSDKIESASDQKETNNDNVEPMEVDDDICDIKEKNVDFTAVDKDKSLDIDQSSAKPIDNSSTINESKVEQTDTVNNPEKLESEQKLSGSIDTAADSGVSEEPVPVKEEPIAVTKV